jgi:hypothetical protein
MRQPLWQFTVSVASGTQLSSTGSGHGGSNAEQMQSCAASFNRGVKYAPT